MNFVSLSVRRLLTFQISFPFLTRILKFVTLHRYTSYLECFLTTRTLIYLVQTAVAFEIRRIDITKRICPDHSKIYPRSLFNFFNAVYQVRGLGHLFLPPRCFLSCDPLVRSKVRSPSQINIWLPIIRFATLCSTKKKERKKRNWPL